jgi:hypothetical protein
MLEAVLPQLSSCLGYLTLSKVRWLTTHINLDNTDLHTKLQLFLFSSLSRHLTMSLESCVDVLIIGAGPAGLMCANALAMAGVDVRIIEQRYV